MKILIKKGEQRLIEHPDGISIHVSKNSFKADAKIFLSSCSFTDAPDNIFPINAMAYRIKSTVASKRPVQFSLYILVACFAV